MKEFLTVLAVLFSGVVAEAQGPYPPSGWRPSGPAFELPQATQRPLKQEYLPPSPVDPRIPAVGPTALPGEDVSVQGLPTQEQLPIFQVSPVNGQQYAGPSFNADIQNLDQSFRQSQLQQQKAREFERQRQIDAQLARRQPTPQTPRQFVQKTTITPEIDESTTTQFDSTTEAIRLNQGEVLDDDSSSAVPDKQKVSVEVTKQNIREYPAELFLSPLTQLKYQAQVVPLEKLSQLRALDYYQPIQQENSQKQVAPRFDGLAHLSALTSILTQKQIEQPQQQQYTQGFVQGPIVFVAGGQGQASDAIAPEPQYQQVINQYQPAAEQEQFQPQQLESQQFQPQQLQPQQIQQQYQPQQYQPQQYQPQQYQPQQYQPQQYQPQQYQPQQYQPQQYQPQQYQPQQYQPQQYQPQQTQPQLLQPQQVQPEQYQPQQYQPQQVVIQPQPFNQPQPNQLPASQNEAGEQLQLVYQQAYQPQSQLQQAQFDQNQQNLFLSQNQDLNQYYLSQQQFFRQNQALGPQDALQSGLDINQQGNDIDETNQNADEENQGATATAVATAFGTRTQPRIPNQYGVPASNPRPKANPGLQTTTETYEAEEVTEDTANVAQATAIARGSQRKNAKLSSRRIRPVFTLDRSGHLVLAREQ